LIIFALIFLCMAGLKFRVLLDSKEPDEIFRDVILPKTSTFEDLYKICIESFHFKGDQMASFYLSDEQWNRGQEITLEDMTEEGNNVWIMREVKVSDNIKDERQKLILVYDFMRMWIFLIEYIGTVKSTPEKPIIALSIGDSPQENSRSQEDITDLSYQIDESLYDDEFDFESADSEWDENDFASFEEDIEY